MAKHTPGPWLAMKGTESTGRQVADWAVSDNVDAWICTGPTWDDEYEEESFANARLIAAAPELLAALILARDRARGFAHADRADTESLDEIDAAIAKALGLSLDELECERVLERGP